METRSVKRGQHEVGVISHDGREFAALGSSVCGRSVTGYIHKDGRGRLSLRRWDGKFTMLACRCSVVKTYWTESMGETAALVFSLTGGGSYIVGYSLGVGCLFRGELVAASSLDDAADDARRFAEACLEMDDEDQAAMDAAADEDGERPGWDSLTV
jgi:hypothetical protein